MSATRMTGNQATARSRPAARGGHDVGAREAVS